VAAISLTSWAMAPTVGGKSRQAKTNLGDPTIPPGRRHAGGMHPQRVEPGPGQESVWDYPRPPAIVLAEGQVVVIHGGVVIADSRRATRVLETSQPPAFYIPREDVAMEHLYRTKARSFCEWKGAATYWAVQVGDEVVPDAAWSYEQPTGAFTAIAHHLAFYPQKLHHCSVDGERARPNPGGFYGGWITSKVVGPFKGAAGTLPW
jgi:uncharacterized protein (DUF427 family)